MAGFELTDSEGAGTALSSAIQQFGIGLQQGRRNARDDATFRQAQLSQSINDAFKQRSLGLQEEAASLSKARAESQSKEAGQRLKILESQANTARRNSDTSRMEAQRKVDVTRGALRGQAIDRAETAYKEAQGNALTRIFTGVRPWKRLNGAERRGLRDLYGWIRWGDSFGFTKPPATLIPKDAPLKVRNLIESAANLSDRGDKFKNDVLSEYGVIDSRGQTIPPERGEPEAAPTVSQGFLGTSIGELLKSFDGPSAVLPGQKAPPESVILKSIQTDPAKFEASIEQFKLLKGEDAQDQLDSTLNQIADDIQKGSLSGENLSKTYRLVSEAFPTLVPEPDQVKKNVDSLLNIGE